MENRELRTLTDEEILNFAENTYKDSTSGQGQLIVELCLRLKESIAFHKLANQNSKRRGEEIDRLRMQISSLTPSVPVEKLQQFVDYWLEREVIAPSKVRSIILDDLKLLIKEAEKV